MIALIFVLVLANVNSKNDLLINDETGKSDSCPNGWVEAVYFEMGKKIKHHLRMKKMSNQNNYKGAF